MNKNLSDAEIDRAAKSYAFAHHVSYSEALDCVIPAMQTQEAAYGESVRLNFVSASDAQLDAAAKAWARTHQVSYSEALECVQFDSTAAFSEAAAATKPATPATASLMGQPIEIFKAGSHIDNIGNTRKFTLADLQAMAACYDPAKHEAPLTLGHPDYDKPAYGWVKGLQAMPDGRLMMQADQVDPAFAEGVKSGRFKKRSASFYTPNSPNNPAPGNWYLKHVGWLGAMPPAVKGLADASFGAAASEGAISFDV